jgi:hypothetical protein
LISFVNDQLVSGHRDTRNRLTAPSDEEAEKAFQGVCKGTVMLAQFLLEKRFDDVILDETLKGG